MILLCKTFPVLDRKSLSWISLKRFSSPDQWEMPAVMFVTIHCFLTASLQLLQLAST